MKLYELTQQYAAIANAIDDTDGEITPEIEAQLDALADALEDKARAYIAIIRKYEAEAAAMKTEETRMQKRRKAREGAVARLRERLSVCMHEANSAPIRTPIGSVSCRTGTSVKVHDAEALAAVHPELVRHLYKPNRAEIKKLIHTIDPKLAELVTSQGITIR